MSRKQASRQFATDSRAVSAVIGFILIFGILMLLLTVYQAQIVPQQNAQTEFTHFEETRDELIELRNSISRSGQAGDPQFPSVQLGTSYQSRILTINPAPPAGTVQTSEEYNISINNGSEDPVNVSTRFIEYQPGYNELTIGSTWYDHSVLYVDNPESNNTVLEDQNLVTDGSELKITAIESEFQETGTSRTTFEINRNQSEIDLSKFEEGENLTVTIPTRQSGPEYWDAAYDDLDAEANIRYDGVDEHGEIYHLSLNATGKSDLSIKTVEIES